MEVIAHRVMLQAAFALVNPLEVPRSEYSGLESITLVPRGMERHARMMPQLLELGALGDTQRLELLQRSERWTEQFGKPLLPVLIEVDCPVAALAHMLRRNMLITDQNRQRYWFRFHDPRVLRHMHWMLTSTQRAALLGGAARWTFNVGGAQGWQQLESEALAPEDPQHVVLSSRQWQEMGLLEALNGVIEDLSLEDVQLDASGLMQVMQWLKEAQTDGKIDEFELRRHALDHVRIRRLNAAGVPGEKEVAAAPLPPY